MTFPVSSELFSRLMLQNHIGAERKKLMFVYLQKSTWIVLVHPLLVRLFVSQFSWDLCE